MTRNHGPAGRGCPLAGAAGATRRAAAPTSSGGWAADCPRWTEATRPPGCPWAAGRGRTALHTGARSR